MKTARIFTLLFLANACFSAGLLAQRPPVKVVGADRFFTTAGGFAVSIPVYASQSLVEVDESVRSVVFSLHGASRNADVYFERMMTPARALDALDDTVVVATQLLMEQDVAAFGLTDDVLAWSNDGWKRGDRSLTRNGRPEVAQLSPFAVLDDFLLRLAALYPNLERIVLAGHSAGGQFVNRYAAANRIHDFLQERHGVAVRYIISNPSTYVYFSEERPLGAARDQFREPTEEEEDRVPSYNMYKYGLDEINHYLARAGEAAMRAQYAEREVVYLLGEDDNDPTHRSLDKSGPALMQGATRLERGLRYFHHVGQELGEEIYERHRVAIVPGVGHHGGKMFDSAAGRYYIFDTGEAADGPLEKWGVANRP